MQHAVSTRAQEVFLPYAVPRERVIPATAIRSTWIGSSIQALRERNLLDMYLGHLPSEYHAQVLEAVAGIWLPIGLGVAHYRACDHLGLSKREMNEIGVSVSRRVHGTSLGVAIRLAKQAGVTPWTVLSQLRRLWERVYVGGDVSVLKCGPKEAIIEVTGWPLAPIAYVRHSMPAVVLGIVEMFCEKAFIREVSSVASAMTFALRVQWA